MIDLFTSTLSAFSDIISFSIVRDVFLTGAALSFVSCIIFTIRGRL